MAYITIVIIGAASLAAGYLRNSEASLEENIF